MSETLEHIHTLTARIDAAKDAESLVWAWVELKRVVDRHAKSAQAKAWSEYDARHGGKL